MGAQIHWLVGLTRVPKSQTRALALLALFVGVQIADAWLTALGVGRFGVAAEANPMLALPIILFGPAAALTIAKGVAVGGAVVLHRLSRHSLLAVLTVMYVFVAILPWASALSLS
jgi:hypothetical protein